MAAEQVLIVGPGYIGWVILSLLSKESPSNYLVTAFCRRKEHGEALVASGAARVVYGSLSDHEIIASETAKHEIVFHTATADDLPSVLAVLDGIKRRASQGKSTTYIHNSGTSLMNDGSGGEYKSDVVYSDKDPAAIDALPDDAPHRPIDLVILGVQRELGEKAKIAVMIPSPVFGYNAWNGRLSMQIPTLTRFALKHGFAGHMGKGLSVESCVHVNDLARAYIVLLKYIEQSEPNILLQNPYFFCENGQEFSWLEVAQEIGKGLFASGKIKDPNPRAIDPQDYQDLFGDDTGAVVGLNSRSRADRLREIGWKPIEKSLWESYHQDELPAILAQEERRKLLD